MFSIIISEKGGAERRESFDKSEINVGRVQGNDLMLPKGNVSKHHARLLFRDGRFIVTDLKSTNGTYVNGRKIAQATIVREGDKIYIGDFVLRLETNGASAGAAPVEVTAHSPEDHRDAGRPAPPQHQPAVTLKAPTHPPGAPPPRPQVSNVSSQSAQPPSPEPAFNRNEPDLDESGPAIPKPQPQRSPSGAPPALGGLAGSPRPMTLPLNQMAPPILSRPQTAPPPPLPSAAQPSAVLSSAAAPTPRAPERAPEAPAPMPAPAPIPQIAAPQPSPQTPSQPAGHAALPVSRPTAPPPRQQKETPAQAGRRLALMTLLDRIADAVDLAPLATSPTVSDALAQQIERAARDQANAMREEGDAPEGIDLDSVIRDAHRELVGLGAFGPLLEDDDVSEITCVKFDQVLAVRNGAFVAESAVFSSEEALARVIARLAAQSGAPWKAGEVVVERRLPRASFVAIAPPAATGHVVSIRKRRRLEASLEDLVRASALSRPMAQFLEACIAARANVLVSGTAPLGAIAALTSATGSDRVVVVQDVEEIATTHAHVVSLAISDTRKLGEESVRAAARLRPDRLVVTQLAGGVAAGTVDAMAEGTDGVLAAFPAPTLRQGISRLVAQLVLYRPGLSLEGMREVVGEAFDIAVEVASLPDGRLRVMRIAELGGSDAKGVVVRDLFVFTPDPAGGEGSFSATGVVPRIANDLAVRGMKLDPAMFKRAGR